MLRALATTILLTFGLAAQSPGTTPPNIVYLMADELGYYELSCMGNPNLETPCIDRMAQEGMRFTQHLAGSSLCAPTRACLMTGKHSGHTSVRSNGGGTPLRAGEVTVASMLRERGYATGGFGKWGCGGRGSTGVPEEHGFDTFVGYYDQVHAHSYYPAYLIENSGELVLAGNTGGRSGQTYSHYVIWQRGIDFIKASAAAQQPFFCYLPVTPPHGMFDIPDDDPAWAIYRDQPWPEDVRRYAAMVTMVDRQLGELFALLRELGLDENTIVFFSGDNGGADYFADKEHPRGFHGANRNPADGVEFRGKKGNLYEGGLRIPMIARWPGRIAPGTVSDHLSYFPDFLPTAAELAGAVAPDDVDGISMLPTLLGRNDEQREHDYLYWELSGQTAVRCEQWKLIRPRPQQPWQLYDLGADVSEAHDVAGAHPEVVAKLAALAESAHTPVVEGTFASRELHEKDRRAKWGENAPQNQGPRPNRLPKKGLLATQDWQVVRVSSESQFNGKVAKNAFDGDPTTIWHTRWNDEPARPPHELVLDLGGRCLVRGFAYLARQDNGWNGTFGRCEFAVSDDPAEFGEPVAAATLTKTKKAQTVEWPAVRGRYLRVRVLSEVGGGPWASAAELGVLGKPAK